MEHTKNEKKPPVKSGEIIKAKIVGTGALGDRIVKKDGYTIIVKTDKKEGDEVEVKIEKVRPKFAFGKDVDRKSVV